MARYTAKEIIAFAKNASREKILQDSGMTRHRYETLKDNPEFMDEVNQYRTSLVGDVVRELESCLMTSAKELTEIIQDHETASQTRLNAIRTMFDAYAKLADREDILKRLDALEKAQNGHIQP